MWPFTSLCGGKVSNLFLLSRQFGFENSIASFELNVLSLGKWSMKLWKKKGGYCQPNMTGEGNN